MEEFTAEQINSAVNRVREMQRRSSLQSKEEKPHEAPKKAQISAPAEARKENPFSRILNIVDLKNFSFDDESKLILGILLLLSLSSADELLILALVYIML